MWQRRFASAESFCIVATRRIVSDTACQNLISDHNLAQTFVLTGLTVGYKSLGPQTETSLKEFAFHRASNQAMFQFARAFELQV